MVISMPVSLRPDRAGTCPSDGEPKLGRLTAAQQFHVPLQIDVPAQRHPAANRSATSPRPPSPAPQPPAYAAGLLPPHMVTFDGGACPARACSARSLTGWLLARDRGP